LGFISFTPTYGLLAKTLGEEKDRLKIEKIS
jgi:hypothetical protein